MLSALQNDRSQRSLRRNRGCPTISVSTAWTFRFRKDLLWNVNGWYSKEGFRSRAAVGGVDAAASVISVRVNMKLLLQTRWNSL
jgi:hypothetical protein